ncbi:uncharacterized protein LOC111700265 isoform X2 [Eurytemora carolleeae]|uniref:uncharacterized protein LOC111700265 isoform X2 n=1 Tax=Eurytemora carolleeae TaxID=1294199 RepID=UPI000C77FB8E|nr:uncharacterized protein LOC111700265 isoform X2 [Eurytemora carolleeae]|eukprot:XP_023326911.1 uncharacterized protein LOC111700265 isoform X2 [Eurytemora affinis]
MDKMFFFFGTLHAKPYRPVSQTAIDAVSSEALLRSPTRVKPSNFRRLPSRPSGLLRWFRTKISNEKGDLSSGAEKADNASLIETDFNDIEATVVLSVPKRVGPPRNRRPPARAARPLRGQETGELVQETGECKQKTGESAQKTGAEDSVPEKSNIKAENRSKGTAMLNILEKKINRKKRELKEGEEPKVKLLTKRKKLPKKICENLSDLNPVTESLVYFLGHQDELEDHQNQLLRKQIRQSDSRLSREIAQQQIKDILSYAEDSPPPPLPEKPKRMKLSELSSRENSTGGISLSSHSKGNQFSVSFDEIKQKKERLKKINTISFERDPSPTPVDEESQDESRSLSGSESNTMPASTDHRGSSESVISTELVSSTEPGELTEPEVSTELGVSNESETSTESVGLTEPVTSTEPEVSFEPRASTEHRASSASEISTESVISSKSIISTEAVRSTNSGVSSESGESTLAGLSSEKEFIPVFNQEKNVKVWEGNDEHFANQQKNKQEDEIELISYFNSAHFSEKLDSEMNIDDILSMIPTLESFENIDPVDLPAPDHIDQLDPTASDHIDDQLLETEQKSSGVDLSEGDEILTNQNTEGDETLTNQNTFYNERLDLNVAQEVVQLFDCIHGFETSDITELNETNDNSERRQSSVSRKQIDFEFQLGKEPEVDFTEDCS